MEIIFLGTSSGVPTKTRNVSAIVVKRAQSKHWCLVDCGEGTQHQLLQTKLSLNHLDAIFITHVHGDHCYGLPGLLASATMAGRQRPLDVIVPAPLIEYIKQTQQLSQTRMSYELNFIDVKSILEPREIAGYQVQAWPLSHRVPSYAFSFQLQHQEVRLDKARLQAMGLPPGPDWGALAAGQDVKLAEQTIHSKDVVEHYVDQRKVIIGGDNDTPELLADAARGASLLVHEATYTEEVSQKVGPLPQHSSAMQVAKFAQQADVPNLILSHFSNRYESGSGYTMADIEQEALAYYKGQLYLANDFDCYQLDKQSKLTLLK